MKVIFKKLLLALAGMAFFVLLLFGNHHWMTIYTYSVEGTLQLKDDRPFHIKEIVHYPFVNKEVETGFSRELPWYYEVDWIPFKMKLNLLNMQSFFTMPFDKQQSKIDIRGVYGGGLGGTDFFGQNVKVKVNGDRLEVTGVTIENNGEELSTVTIEVRPYPTKQFDHIKNISIQYEDREIEFSFIDEQDKDTHRYLDPFQRAEDVLTKLP
ncbi:MAG: hypothetical protein H0Z32_03205 [Bacillaceae bacterium]|nr:hypothetical protein [Bacillaceae bacterium]